MCGRGMVSPLRKFASTLPTGTAMVLAGIILQLAPFFSGQPLIGLGLIAGGIHAFITLNRGIRIGFIGLAVLCCLVALPYTVTVYRLGESYRAAFPVALIATAAILSRASLDLQRFFWDEGDRLDPRCAGDVAYWLAVLGSIIAVWVSRA